MSAKRTPKPVNKPSSGRETVAGVLAQVSKPGAKGADKEAVTTSPAVIQRGTGGRFVSSNAVKFRATEELRVETQKVETHMLEARAADEPAVIVSADVAAKAAGVDLHPAPRQLTPLQRLWGWLRRDAQAEKKAEKAEMATHMAAVKAGVMHELETIGAKKGIAIKGSPFASVILPVKPRRNYRRWMWVAAALVVLVGAMLWVGSRQESPASTLTSLNRAIAMRDADRVVQLVDLPSVATSIVNQMFSLPPRDALAVHAALLVKPGMVLELQRDILEAVRGNAAGAETLPLRLYGLLGSDNLEIGRANVRMQDAGEAVAEVPLHRRDLALTLPLQVVLEHRDDHWVVVNIPNFVHVLSGIVQAEAAAGATRAANATANAEVVQAPVVGADTGRPVLDAGSVEVESLAKPESRGANMLLRARVANHSASTVTDARLVVQFGDAAQRPLLTLHLPLEGTMLADEVREQVWSVPVDTTEPHAATVARLPLGAMSVTATVAF
ncbi:MAG: hypothetical protein DI628_08105 [Blastochloris viridis]|uniref:Uncharacterized protein n=1 Tax=Blastochloris viridis TaxID=1079 RepID=A0A6N4R103_BLAVI|nr:MAG: hypothetical protein DI628_08105 [Blastochloris viridis]